ncbi:MAG: YjgP/YjgQ family permease, partial [bacterium]|nr:YjgP/YjgQ family permease [bacterium]
MKIIHRYIVVELIGPFLFGVTVATLIMMLSRIFKMVEMIISKGVDALTVIELFAYFLPAILALTIPMAMLVGTLMAFGRLSTDNEITALKSGGVSILSIITPVFIVGLLMSVGMFFFLDRVVPESNLRFKNLLMDIGMKRPDLNLKERVFVRDFPGYEIYVGHINDRTGEMSDITIFNIQGGLLKSTIIAREGKMVTADRPGFLALELYDGEVHEVDAENPSTYHRLHFDTQLFNLEYDSELIRTNIAAKGDREMTRFEMNEEIEKLGNTMRAVEESYAGSEMYNDEFYHSQIEALTRRSNEYLVEVHKKEAIPFACAILVLVGAPLGIVVRRAGKGIGFSVAILF